MNSKAKGNRNELKTVHLLKSIGYTCTKSGGSLGIWDVIALHPTHMRLIQVKSNDPPGPAEREKLMLHRAPMGASKEIWIWVDRESRPKVEVL